MKTDQEIFELRAKVCEEFFKFSNSCKKELSVNDEFIAFTLLTYCGTFLGGAIDRETAERAFELGFSMGERITGHPK